MDIFQSQRFKSSLKRIGDTTSRLARVMRTDARTKKNDYAEISRLNDRLKRTIPIIPAAFGISGAILGRGLDDGEFPGFFRFPGFGGPPILPPQGPGNPPQDPTDSTEADVDTEVDTDVDVNTNTDRDRDRDKDKDKDKDKDREKDKPGVIVPPKPKEDEPDVEEEEEEKKPIPLPDPPPTPIPLTPPFPLPRRKKEEEEEKELVPTAMSLYEFELALRSRRQKEKGANPGWLGPYYAYLLEYFRKEIHPNLPKLSSVLDAYRHAVGSAIEANKRGSVVATGMGIGKEAIDAFKFGKQLITGRSPINKIPTYLEATSGDMYNNRLGRKFSASRNDAMKELNKVFINQLKRMKDEGPNFKFQENVDFKFLDQDY